MRSRTDGHIFYMILYICFATGLSANAQEKIRRKQDPNDKEYQAKLTLFRSRGTEALAAEASLEREDRCRKAVTTFDIDECESNLLDSTKKNYTAYVRAIGALLRLGDSSNFTGQKPPDAGAAFDAAELLWIKYRGSQCESSGNLYWGGTMRPGAILGCQILLTQHHLHELKEIYADLWS